MSSIVCHQCGRAGKLPAGFAGKRARCPGCKAMIDVPPPVPAPLQRMVDDDAFDLDGAIAQATAAAASRPAPPPVTTPAPPGPVFMPLNDGDDEPDGPLRVGLGRGSLPWPSLPPGGEARPLPWYYQYLRAYALLTVAAGVVVALVVALVGLRTGLGVHAIDPDSGVRIMAATTAIAIGALAAASFVPAVVLLALDVGRSLRQIVEADRARGGEGR